MKFFTIIKRNTNLILTRSRQKDLTSSQTQFDDQVSESKIFQICCVILPVICTLTNFAVERVVFLASLTGSGPKYFQ